MFHAEHPAIELHLSEQGSRRLLDELAGGELDLALITTSDATSAERFTVTPLLVEELVVISSAGAPPVTTARHHRARGGRGPAADRLQLDLRPAQRDGCRLPRGRISRPTSCSRGRRWTRCCGSSSAGSASRSCPAMVLIDRPGLRSVRLGGPTLERTISVARPADVAPTAAVEVMRHTITASATAFAARAGATMRLAGERGEAHAHRPSRTPRYRRSMGRTDQASLLVHVDRDAVFTALTSRDALLAWLPPKGMQVGSIDSTCAAAAAIAWS